VREIRVARDEAERAASGRCRKRAFGAVGRLAPNYCTQDGSCRDQACPTSCAHRGGGERHRVRIGNVFHAGDGNIHPILLFDERDPDEVAVCSRPAGHPRGLRRPRRQPHRRARHRRREDRADAAALRPDDLRAMTRLRAVFDPEGRANPHKIFPDAKVCVEARAPRRRAAV
jgi:glycolate oxidase